MLAFEFRAQKKMATESRMETKEREREREGKEERKKKQYKKERQGQRILEHFEVVWGHLRGTWGWVFWGLVFVALGRIWGGFRG